MYWETCSVKEKLLAAEASRGEGNIVVWISGGINGRNVCWGRERRVS